MAVHLTIPQIRAALGLLNWNHGDLASRIDVTTMTISRLLSGSNPPRESTERKIQAVFDENGIEFMQGGARKRDDTITILEGADAYLRLMDDIYHSMHGNGGEVLFLFGDDRVTTEEGRAAEARLRSADITFRTIIEEGNTTINGPAHEYRAVKSEFFNNDLVVIYADKVAQLIDKGEKIVLIRNPSSAITMNKTFEFMWQSLKPLEA